MEVTTEKAQITNNINSCTEEANKHKLQKNDVNLRRDHDGKTKQGGSGGKGRKGNDMTECRGVSYREGEGERRKAQGRESEEDQGKESGNDLDGGKRKVALRIVEGGKGGKKERYREERKTQ